MIRTVLVALDASARAPGVLAAACSIAQRFGAVVVPLRAIAIPPDFPPAAHLTRGDPLPAYLLAVAKNELTSLLAATPSGVNVEPPRVRVGQPWRAILDEADACDADLVVLGSHGYHGVDRILGTTAAKVVNLSTRSVLVVRDTAGAGRLA